MRPRSIGGEERATNPHAGRYSGGSLVTALASSVTATAGSRAPAADTDSGSYVVLADAGHGTHVAGTIAGAMNGIGVSGVAPDVGIVNIRGGQDSGYFFLGPVATP